MIDDLVRLVKFGVITLDSITDAETRAQVEARL